MSREQAMTALAQANIVRLRRASVRRSLAEGQMTLLAVLDEPTVQSCWLIDVLAWQRRWGTTSAQRVLARRGMSPRLKVSDLSPRRKADLALAVNAQAGAGHAHGNGGPRPRTREVSP